ncbi:MAG: sterol desaturase family protein [Gammaproteobacteria bacterium]|nr:sterol desaturase family protein [Gammaproteobacteria bacterium]
MNSLYTSTEPAIRLSVFLVVLIAMMTWEWLTERRPQTLKRSARWPANLLLLAIDTAAVRLLFPLAAVGAAIYASDHGLGLFNVVTLPAWLAVILVILALDLAIYFQHRLFHAVPVLWRLHRVHHADQEFDVTTALRFHPLEILLSMLIKIALVVALGAPPVAVMIFEILLNATAMFNHGNVRLPAKADRYLRMLLVTPDMHRVHHSVIRQETDSNFGFNLACWDRLFGSYRDQPAQGQMGMTIGLEYFRSPMDQRLWPMLTQPFRNPG